MSNFKDKRLNLSDITNVIALSICILGIVFNRLASLSYSSVFSEDLMQFWYLEMSAIIVGFVLINNIKVRFYLFLAAVLTYINNTTYALYLQSSFSEIVFLYYFHCIAIYASNYYVLKYGPTLIGRLLYSTLKIETGTGYFISSTDVYIVKLHRYMVVFYCSVFAEYIIRHGNPLPEIYDTSQLLLLYNLMPFCVPLYLAAFYGLLVREALFSPIN